MNVDNPDEAVELLTARGFKKAGNFKETEETSTSRSNIKISPTGFILNVSKHKK